MKSTITRIAIFITALLFCNGCGSDDPKWKTISASSDSNSNGTSMLTPDDTKKSGGFTENLPDGFVQPLDDAGKRLLKEYGAVFVARGGAMPPNVVVFKNDEEVSAFQAKASSSRESISGVSIELQQAAMAALKTAVAEANQSGESITPRGTDAAKRSYQDTVELWASRVTPGLTHWTSQGRITSAEAQKISSLSPYEQVPEIFKLEAKGIYFAKSLDKSIIYSVAPPGSSQHLSMLALDVTEHDNAQARSILAKHGWFQTVESDLPHFTFLGVAQSELPKIGLKKVSNGGRVFYVPEMYLTNYPL